MRPTNLAIACAAVVCLPRCAEAQDATQIVRDAWNHWRGTSSYAEITMTIHRPTWERSMSMRAWTEGEKKSLVRVTAPAKDRGNGTLMDDNNMWTYSPKVNRVIKVPSSMMGQSWMGSDFSNKDVSRADAVIENYTHSIIGAEEVDGVKVYEIEAIPTEDAAVVWGKEILKIREDHVLLEENFFDQDGVLVKSMKASDIREMGGRTIATRQRMQKAETPDEWTEMIVDDTEYDVELGANLFTLSNLRNPRD
ncbi:MAG: outer membrane lipoprotein-sorting protein [Gammaproteobacteria bacterium]|nr:outer membrane lipoprotein-sorting protein [Gammaproteobacteria bacterium]NND35850.1 outer membrane lipoprotein-sorting protein [Gammaproteobacteria bacterium]